MRYFLRICFFILSPLLSQAQEETAILTSQNYNAINELFISDKKGWYFKKGNSVDGSPFALDLAGWQRLSPEGLTRNMADENGRIEGWFRFYFKLDKELASQALAIRFNCWAAADAYLNGHLIQSHGSTGANGKSFREFNPSNQLPDTTAFAADSSYVLAIHFVDEVVSAPLKKIKSEDYGLNRFVRLVGPQYYKRFAAQIAHWPVFISSILIIFSVLVFLFWLLALLNKEEENLRWVAISITSTLLLYAANTISESNEISYTVHKIALAAWIALCPVTMCIMIYLLTRIFGTRVSRNLIAVLALYILLGFINIFLQLPELVALVNLASIIIVSGFLISFRKKVKGAQWALVIGLSVAQVFTFTWLAMVIYYQTTFIPYSLLLIGCMTLPFPFSLLIYVALRFKEIIRDVRSNADKVIQLTEQQKETIVQQKSILEQEVSRQTIELRTSLENLQSAQVQLIQSEKMASLGELTAGIAHEIQNPLNFVNNFSEVSNELIGEMQEEMKKGNYADALQIAGDIQQNLEKINHHGKRADGIVKGMLQHSRSSSSVKEPTDINALCDEYLRLSYHGLRAKDKSFNATLKTDFDTSIGKIDIVPQDIGRVILNLLTNAFYAVTEKKRSGIEPYEPAVSITTKKMNSKIEIRIADNGKGISQKVLDKIFHPFFTTKPTGQGTGLGLSLSYDIISKGHGGNLKVETKEGEGSTFIIQLPAKQQEV